MSIVKRRKQNIDPAVNDFFKNHPSSDLEVMVVVDLPQAKMSPFPKPGSFSMAEVEMPDPETSKKQLAVLKAKLDGFEVSQVTWLEMAQSFVAIVNADQLKKISALAEIKEILPNSMLR